MKAMILKRITDLKENSIALYLVDIPTPEPYENEVRNKISVCGVCHTELDLIKARLVPPKLPVVLGHQVVGLVEKLGSGATKFMVGDREGVPLFFHFRHYVYTRGWSFNPMVADRPRPIIDNYEEDDTQTKNSKICSSYQ